MEVFNCVFAAVMAFILGSCIVGITWHTHDKTLKIAWSIIASMSYSMAVVAFLKIWY